MTLLPCAHCGSEATCHNGLNKRGDYVCDVVCDSCPASVGTFIYRDKEEAESEAIAAWNRRAPVKGASHE